MIDAESSTVSLVGHDAPLAYDWLVIASGTTPRPDMVPGMDGDLWREKVFDFYTLEGATALRRDAPEPRRGPSGRPHQRDADQVSGGAVGVRVPRGRLLLEAAPAPQGRHHLRDAARRRVHQACRQRSARRSAARPQHPGRRRLRGRVHRQRSVGAGRLRRPRGRLRPARDRAPEHGCRVRQQVRVGRRHGIRARRQAHVALHAVRQRLRHRRRRERPDVEGRRRRPLRGRPLRRELHSRSSPASR